MSTLPRGRSLTVEDLAAMPDDGHRYELVDGTLVVTPAPGLRHQTVSVNLSVALASACPGGLRVLAAPFDVTLGPSTGVQPDLLVARRADFGEQGLPTAPLLAVEILSPSTRLVDLSLKKVAYEAAGTPSYWVVDPDPPRLMVWKLDEGRFIEVADVSGQDTWRARSPFDVSIRPSDLLA